MLIVHDQFLCDSLCIFNVTTACYNSLCPVSCLLNCKTLNILQILTGLDNLFDLRLITVSAIDPQLQGGALKLLTKLIIHQFITTRSELFYHQ